MCVVLHWEIACVPSWFGRLSVIAAKIRSSHCALAQDLKAGGANVWLDQIELIPGLPWDNAIEEALLSAPQMLVILSPTSVKSENVRDEISYALKQGKTVIPVLYMECVIPLRLERKQHIDFRNDYARGLAHLLKYLGERRSRPGRTRTGRQRRRPAAGGVAGPRS